MGVTVYWVQSSVWDDEGVLEMDSGDGCTTHCQCTACY